VTDFSITAFFVIYEVKMKLKLSVQALNALMLSLQKCLAEETDIVPTLVGFDWEIYDEHGNKIGFEEESDDVFALWVRNPPVASVLGEQEDDFSNVEVETL
jgi:hypothetical protein